MFKYEYVNIFFEKYILYLHGKLDWNALITEELIINDGFDSVLCADFSGKALLCNHVCKQENNQHRPQA